MSPSSSTTRTRMLRTLGVAARVLLPIIVFWLVWGELQALDWPQIRAEIARSREGLLLLAAGVVGVNVLVMGLYDAWSFPRAPGLGFLRRWGIGSLCFAWSNFLTIGPIGGPALRFVVYRRRGLTAPVIARGLAIQYIGFAAGLLAWFGAAALPERTGLPARVLVAGLLAILLSLLIMRGWAAAAARRDAASPMLELLRWRRCLPLALTGFLDWGCSILSFTLIAHALDIRLEPAVAAATFLGGHVLGMISMMPGGMGSADAAWLLSLTEYGLEPDVAAAIILLFRGIFYVLPWSVAALVSLALVGAKVEDTRRWRRRALGTTIAVFACFTLVVTALPETGQQIMVGPGHLPLLLIETAHLVVVLAAAGLLVLAPFLAAGSGRAVLAAAVLLMICAVSQATTERDQLETVLSIAVLGLLVIAWLRSRPWPGRIGGAKAAPARWRLVSAGLCLAAFIVHLLGGLFGLPAGRWTNAAMLMVRHGADGSRFLRSVAVLGVAGGVGITWLLVDWRRRGRLATAGAAP